MDAGRAVGALLGRMAATPCVVKATGTVKGDTVGERLQRARRELAKIKKPKDLKRAGKVAPDVGLVADELLGETLRDLAYAAALAGSNVETALAAGAARRHDFGTALKDGAARRRTPWTVAVQQTGAGVEWHALGSLLALDLGFADTRLRRLAGEPPPPPTMTTPEHDVFVRWLPLLNPTTLSDAARDTIARRLARGRKRLTGLAPAGATAFASDAGMSEWRRRRSSGPLRLRRRVWRGSRSPRRAVNWAGAAGDEQDGTGAVLDAWARRGRRRAAACARGCRAGARGRTRPGIWAPGSRRPTSTIPFCAWPIRSRRCSCRRRSCRRSWRWPPSNS